MPDKRTWRILNVDDNEAGRYATTRILSRAGFEVLEAANGTDALRLVADQHPDLVLLDVNLPDISGFEVCRQIKMNPDTASILVIHLSALYVSPKDRVEGLTKGADGYLVHPVAPDELVETIRAFLRIREMEGALRESEERYRMLFENMLDGFAYCRMIYDVEGHPEDLIYLNVNKAFDQIIGIKTVTGKRFTEVFPGIRQAFPELFEIYGRVSLTGIPESFEIDFRPIEKWLHISVYSPEKEHFVAVFEDITERKRAEDALHLSNILLSTQMEVAIEGILVVDDSGKIISYNHRFTEIWGISPDIIASRSDERVLQSVLDDLVNPEEFLTRVQYLYTHREEKSIEEVLLKDGRVLERYSAPMFGENNQYFGRVWHFQDITNRKKTEEEITRIAHEWEITFNATSDGICLIDANQNLQRCNDRMREILGGVIDKDLVDQPCWKVVHKATGPIPECPFVSAKKTLTRTRIEIPAGDHWFEVTADPIIDRSGTFAGAVHIMRDITDRKRAEDALRHANKQLNLLSSITRHDILNQLMVLKGYLELSKDVIDKPGSLMVYIGKVEAAANAIEHQITFTKNYQDLGVAAPAWQNVNANIEKALTELPMRDIVVKTDSETPEIFADPLFEKVFYNLIDNALRYGGTRMKTIRISYQVSGDCLLIICEDDGVGITMEDKKRLFTRGFGKNTGLGLFLSREILAITGISITENGVPGTGARFEITVPTGIFR